MTIVHETPPEQVRDTLPALEIRELTKRYGAVTAVDRVSLAVVDGRGSAADDLPQVLVAPHGRSPRVRRAVAGPASAPSVTPFDTAARGRAQGN